MIPKLLYFNLRARGEVLRMMFLYSGIPFEDVVVPITDWASGQFDKDSIPAGRSGRKQLPVLVLENDKKIPESLDIAQWMATQKPNLLMPTTPENQAKAERIFLYPDQQMDNRLGLANPLLNFFSEEDVASSKIQSFAKMVPNHLEYLEKEIMESSSTSTTESSSPCYVCGPQITYPDFIVFHFLDNLCTLFGHDNILECRSNPPILKTYYNNIRSIPAIEQHLESRPKPGSGLIGTPSSIIYKHSDPSQLDFVQQAWNVATKSSSEPFAKPQNEEE